MRYWGALLVLAGCALTRNAPPRELRHFTPASAIERPAPVDTRCGELTLGRVLGGSHLRYRIVRRTSPVEIELYDTLRWTERPDIYVRRALAYHLFERGALVETTGRGGLVLDVEVLAYEQVDARGRVELRYQLRDQDHVVTTGHVVSESRARTPTIEAVVTAIGKASDEATSELAGRIGTTVRERSGCPHGT